MRPALVVLFLNLFLSVPALAEQHQGRVVGVHDGDTFTLLDAGNQQTKVRLAEIDAPEYGQSYGKKAKQELSSLIFGKAVMVTVQDTDRYGRLVGRVFADNQDVNAQMIERGAAWVYLKYLKDPSLLPLQTDAQQAKRGLWKLPESERIPPWEWRHPTIPTIKTPQANAQGFTCATKQTCRQMTSCEEARFYLNSCGLSSLDGNHDGVPCASLCR
ncbi:thermonuclease family protein [Methylomonas fluvii]|uniref:Thermonuclease family protein n=1 Tax=Methylomonas fluvii TaxID=1854564 RepID=A0ABR9DFA4_9GAMM|nr:thermonuclease family protein [Methylomonas fluvii]MBD9361767.1 thermonuclease family protein [Methylomonas fluvii]